MNSLRYLKSRWRLWSALALSLAALLLAFFTFGFSDKPAAQPDGSVIPQIIHTVATPALQSYRGLPVRLKIPAIGVDTKIEYMGDTPSGDMDAPKGLVNAGWYKFGPIPGDTGSSVIAGHVVGFKNEPGVFVQLDRLKLGDLLLVTDAKAKTASFTVRELKTYDPTQQHNEVFNSVSGTHLNLITCAGDWDSGHLHYLKRLVVFADLSP